jgi:membrane fusion protein (multidrug efflux system)
VGQSLAFWRIVPTRVAIAFSRSVRSIEADGYRRSGIVFLVAFALVGAWAGWFLFARVALVEVAETARLEVDQAAHSVDAPVSGKIASSQLVLGQDVRAGEVLAELDTEPLRLSAKYEDAKLTAFPPQIAALAHEIAADEKALEEHRRAVRARVDESEAGQREAESALSYAENEMRRAHQLRTEGLTSEAEEAKAKSEAAQKRAALDGARLATARIQAEQRAVETERQASIASRQKELAQLEGQHAMSVATLAQLEYEIERRQIRAPIAGRVGDVTPLRPGAVVKEGEKLAAIIPTGDVRIVAEFLPAAAVARVRPGQSARMRPDGFPWTQYGMLAATVRRVANEPHSGRIRVELEVDGAGSPIPLTHGLPGTLEIETERVSPATLVFRAAGRRLSAPASTPSTGARLGQGQ